MKTDGKGSRGRHSNERPAIVRGEWQGTPSQQRDHARRGEPGSRRLGSLPLPPSARSGTVEVDGVPIELRHLDRVMFPQDGITKRDLLDYAHDVAEFLLPHTLDRPFVLKRYPNGLAGKSFFQKEAGRQMPAWVPTIRLPSSAGREWINFVLCNDCPTLLWLVNLGCIEEHCWMSRADTPAQPDYVLLDLDPGRDAPFSMVIRVAQQLRALLDDLQIVAVPKTSGATGMHICIPVAPGHTYDQSQKLAALLLRLAALRTPELTTEVWSLARRPQDRVYLDYRQNVAGKTIPPPYSPRPRPGCPVSTPLQWQEVKPGLDPARFTLTAIRQRLDRYGDLFAGLLPGRHPQQMIDIFARIEARFGGPQAA